MFYCWSDCRCLQVQSHWSRSSPGSAVDSVGFSRLVHLVVMFTRTLILCNATGVCDIIVYGSCGADHMSDWCSGGRHSVSPTTGWALVKMICLVEFPLCCYQQGSRRRRGSGCHRSDWPGAWCSCQDKHCCSPSRPGWMDTPRLGGTTWNSCWNEAVSGGGSARIQIRERTAEVWIPPLLRLAAAVDTLSGIFWHGLTQNLVAVVDCIAHVRHADVTEGSDVHHI